MNLVNLDKKKIIVFGASSGIGRATAILLSKLGAQVVLVARRKELLQDVAEEMEDFGLRGGTAHAIYPFDLSHTNQLEDFCKKIVEENGKIDGLVYCAGIAGTRPLKFLKPEQLLEIFQINLFPFIEVVRCLTRKNAYNPGMSIVGISSVSSMQGGKGKTGYCASKGAMDAAVRAMAKELAPGKIRINTICPGLLQTDMYDTARDNGGGDFQNIVERQYLGIGKPEDAASLAAFLLSDASRFITGTSMVADGGRTTS